MSNENMSKGLQQKYLELKKMLGKFGSTIIAFSGGTDSALLLKVAHDVLGDKAIAVTADSPSLPRSELNEAKKTAQKIGARHFIVSTNEAENENYAENPSNRCYYCKSELYAKLKVVSAQLGVKSILNGTNFDDLRDYRPGLKAAEQNNVASPLKDAKLAKDEVRELARHLGLEIWDKPSSPCLSSRIPYNNKITLKKLSMIEEAEGFLKGFGIKELRVRHFGSKAGIEVNEADKAAISQNLPSIKKKFSEIGFNEITLSNFKSGALNLIKNGRTED